MLIAKFIWYFCVIQNKVMNTFSVALTIKTLLLPDFSYTFSKPWTIKYSSSFLSISSSQLSFSKQMSVSTHAILSYSFGICCSKILKDRSFCHSIFLSLASILWLSLLKNLFYLKLSLL